MNESGASPEEQLEKKGNLVFRWLRWSSLAPLATLACWAAFGEDAFGVNMRSLVILSGAVCVGGFFLLAWRYDRDRRRVLTASQERPNPPDHPDHPAG